MKLKEILKKATPRPWEIDAWTALVRCHGNEADVDEADAALIVRAVNNFEKLLKACDRAYCSVAFASMHPEDCRFIKETIRKTEEG